MADAGQVDTAGSGINAAHSLQHFALTEHDDGGSGEPGQRTVQSGNGQPLQHQAKHTVVHGISRHRHRQRGKHVNANPNRNDAQ